jgi:hypothetical protein
MMTMNVRITIFFFDLTDNDDQNFLGGIVQLFFCAAIVAIDMLS